MNKKLRLVLTFGLLAAAGSANAVTLLGQAPDSSLIVSAGGLEWVYAAPCAGEAPSCGVVQLHHGFQFPTDAQWNASFASIGALQAAFTNPNKCASTYFSVAHDHCDFGDIGIGAIWHSPLAVAGLGNAITSETFLVRGNVPPPVPEPGTLALLGLGLIGLGVGRRRRS